MGALTRNGAFLRLNGGGRLRLPQGVAPDLRINSISGSATSPTSGTITVEVNKPCILHWRIYSGAAPTNKLAEFPNSVTLDTPGRYTYQNGGSLSTDTGYGCAAWLEATELGDTDTEIVVAAFPAFTTPGTFVNAPPTSIQFAAGGTSRNVSEVSSVSSIIATATSDGFPAPTFTKTADPDGKFTVNADGSIVLAAALDFDTTTSHTLTVQATNSEGSTSQVLTVNVTEQITGGGTITPDVTVNSMAALTSQLSAWNGDAVTETRYIALTAGDHTSAGTTIWQDYRFNGQVVVYSADENCGAIVPPLGRIGCKNLTLYALRVRGSGLTGSVNTGVGIYCTAANDIEDCHTDNCIIERQAADPGLLDNYYHFGFLSKSIDGSGRVIRCNVTNNHIRYYVNGMNWHGGCNGWAEASLIEGNHMGKCGADGFRLSSGGYQYFYRNFPMRARPADPAGHRHSDAIQFKGGTVEMWGNIIGLIDPEEGIMQGYFAGTPNSSIYNIWYNQCFALMNSTNGITGSSDFMTSPIQPSRYNDCIRGTHDPNHGVISGDTRISLGDSDYGIVAAALGSDSGQGPNGTIINVGDVKGIRNPFTPASRIDPAVYAPHYTDGNFDGNWTLAQILPPSTTARTHWNTTDPAGPVGCYLRKKELFDGIHPGRLCVPAVAQLWQEMWDPVGATHRLPAYTLGEAS